MEFQTPDSIIQQLEQVRNEASKGVDVLLECETEVARLDQQFSRVQAQALLDAVGTVVDRQALATLAASDVKFELDLARAKLARVKAKLRMLQDVQTNIQTQARMVELTYKTAGAGR
jgi:hypothetical protein